MNELTTGLRGTVNGKACTIKAIDSEGPLKHLLLVEFESGLDCLRTIERPEGRTAYITRGAFVREVVNG